MSMWEREHHPQTMEDCRDRYDPEARENTTDREPTAELAYLLSGGVNGAHSAEQTQQVHG